MEVLCKCRALFWYSFYQMNEGIEVYYSFIYDLLYDFLKDNYECYSGMFNLMFCFYTDDDNKLSIYEPKFIDDAVHHYLLLMDDDLELLKMYDQIGFDRVNKISKLCTLFCEYLMDKFEVMSNVSTHIKQ